MAVISPGASVSNALPSRYGELKSEDFVKLIFTELRNQDPFKPNDSGELLKQIDSIRSIQTNMELGDRLSQVADSAQLMGAGDLIGRFVKGLSTDFVPVSGNVIAIQQTSEGPLLELENGQFIPMSFVQSILAQDPAGSSGSGDGSGSGTGGGDGGSGGGSYVYNGG